MLSPTGIVDPVDPLCFGRRLLALAPVFLDGFADRLLPAGGCDGLRQRDVEGA
jgi:hypothetical protein